jgi:hypothetical protein
LSYEEKWTRLYVAGKRENQTERNASTKWILQLNDAKEVLSTKNTRKDKKGLSATMVVTKK